MSKFLRFWFWIQKVKYYVGWVFLIAVILGCVLLLVLPRKNNGDFCDVEATVVSVEPTFDIEGVTYLLHAVYTVDGVEYPAETVGAGTVQPGEKIFLQYNEKDPANWRTPPSEFFFYVKVGVVLLIALILLSMLFRAKRIAKETEKRKDIFHSRKP